MEYLGTVLLLYVKLSWMKCSISPKVTGGQPSHGWRRRLPAANEDAASNTSATRCALSLALEFSRTCSLP